MPALDALIPPLLMVMAAAAVVLGLAAKILAARLLLDLDRADNDPVFRRSHRIRLAGTHVAAHAGEGRARLYVVT